MFIIVFMKILIAASDSNTVSSLFLEEILHTLTDAGIDTALSAPDGGFTEVSYYPSPVPRSPLFNFHADNRTCEEYLYSRGCLSEKYIQKDIEAMQDTINAFHPELIIAINRPAALLSAQLNELPCWVIVHPAMYRDFYFPAHCLHGFNAVCSRCRLEQQLKLSSFYRTARRRIGFGPLSFSPFLTEENVTRLGLMCEASHPSAAHDALVIVPGQLHLSEDRFSHMVEEAFNGASYPVHVCNADESGIVGNIHYHTGFDPKLLTKASALIHDGSSYMTSLAFAHNLPQIILSDHTCFRSFNAIAVQRTRTGVFLYEEDLSIASLYEAYRTILSDDIYTTSTDAMRREAERRGSIKEIVDLLYIDLINQ